MSSDKRELRPVHLSDDGEKLVLLDQRLLPGEERWISLEGLEEIAEAIETLTVRGAPAIGCAAALGLYVVSRGFPEEGEAFRARFAAALERLAGTRPTAVNLFVALQQQRDAVDALPASTGGSTMRMALLRTAKEHVQADLRACHAIGDFGAGLLPDHGGVLTHCNAGGLATAGYGTALGVIRRAWAQGKKIEVYADETRPLLQGGRLTSWELAREGIPVTVIADNMAGALMAAGRISAAVVGADRITRNGDVANKIGTYTVAVLCKHHRIPFFVAAPWTTIDLSLASGAEIPIEQRNPDEVRFHGGRLMTPVDVPVANPAFDVTPANLVSKIITERGVYEPDALPFTAPTG
jgi:methylthioribose-1-phosphate isomerase